MPQLHITVQYLADNGQPIYGYAHVEQLVPSEDAQETALRGMAELLKRVDEARQSVLDQSARDIPRLPGEQAKLEQRFRELRGDA